MTTTTDEPFDDPVFDALWARVAEAWDDDKTHAALLDHALRTRTLPQLAGRYRTLIDDPERGDLAKKKLGVIVLAATESLWAMKTPTQVKVPLSITLTAFAICAVLLVWLAMAMRPH